MSIFCISDLHLSTSDKNKSMEVFGNRWSDYIRKIETNWKRLIKPSDSVVIPGDISWATRLEDSLSDLIFLDSLPGTKYIGKGNHDFWWATQSKQSAFYKANNITTLNMLYNNAYRVEDKIICGTRGWFLDEKQQTAVGDVDYGKIVNREKIRLKLSLDSAKSIKDEVMKNEGVTLPIIVFLHFPPVWSDFVCEEFIDLLTEYDVKVCYFGHIHGVYSVPQKTQYRGIEFILASSDYNHFTPIPVI